MTAPWHGAKLATLSMMMTCAILESTADAYLELTDETRRLIGEKQLRRMKPTALLINTEPLPAASPLRGVDPERLILTPHDVGRSEAGRRANLNPEAIPRLREQR